MAAVSVILAVSGRVVPGFAQWYGTHLYPLWVGSIGRLMGYFPFSVSEMLLYVLLAWVIRGIAKSVAEEPRTVCWIWRSWLPRYGFCML